MDYGEPGDKGTRPTTYSDVQGTASGSVYAGGMDNVETTGHDPSEELLRAKEQKGISSWTTRYLPASNPQSHIGSVSVTTQHPTLGEVSITAPPHKGFPFTVHVNGQLHSSHDNASTAFETAEEKLLGQKHVDPVGTSQTTGNKAEANNEPAYMFTGLPLCDKVIRLAMTGGAFGQTSTRTGRGSPDQIGVKVIPPGNNPAMDAAGQGNMAPQGQGASDTTGATPENDIALAHAAYHSESADMGKDENAMGAGGADNNPAFNISSADEDNCEFNLHGSGALMASHPDLGAITVKKVGPSKFHVAQNGVRVSSHRTATAAIANAHDRLTREAKNKGVSLSGPLARVLRLSRG